jgi:hypothetical protein
MKIIAFWHIPPCSLVEIDRRFRAVALMIKYAHLKRRSTLTILYDAVPLKAVIYILAAVRS